MKKVIIGLVVTVVVLLAIIGGGAVYMFGVSLDRKVTPTDEEDAYAFLYEHDPSLKIWVDSLRENSALRDTFIVAADGSKLHALYIRSAIASPNTALIIHGYTDNSIRMLMIGHLYNKEMGYNILLPDLRAHGKSDGEYIQMGWKDRLDIMKWIDVTKGIYGDTTRMVIHGISMGAATTMMTSGEDLPENIKCFVEDCGYTSVWDEFTHKLKDDYGLPAFPILNAASSYSQMKVGWNFKEASALEQLKKSKLPMFFIHGDKDTYVPTWMVNVLYEAKQGDKELWVVPNVEHANAYWDCTDEYVAKTNQFVSKYIN
ncbi:MULTISPECIES: alpha/beta hydrolase [unclassified Dysgonomonas]|uniref:alpha/beta hydrolase n=1 Tax=unclassified Dysgonomonas TaxID=2630389 RepID=UPI0006804752|nr:MULTISPECIES: alpha/beta hydrolase [unclassified Dysgonomonas]MBD8348932.1 alpha/beta hydrolase [Dysgonomonas sp. HGC4]MBF0576414.1 alpha/beta hydrolase [Dysgonomonas sp. GY617]